MLACGSYHCYYNAWAISKEQSGNTYSAVDVATVALSWAGTSQHRMYRTAHISLNSPICTNDASHGVLKPSQLASTHACMPQTQWTVQRALKQEADAQTQSWHLACASGFPPRRVWHHHHPGKASMSATAIHHSTCLANALMQRETGSSAASSGVLSRHVTAR